MRYTENEQQKCWIFKKTFLQLEIYLMKAFEIVQLHAENFSFKF